MELLVRAKSQTRFFFCDNRGESSCVDGGGWGMFGLRVEMSRGSDLRSRTLTWRLRYALASATYLRSTTVCCCYLYLRDNNRRHEKCTEMHRD
jgi:hypothetical protein